MDKINEENKDNNIIKNNFVAVKTIIDDVCKSLIPVTQTLGPMGNTMFMNQFTTKVTKDGASVLKEISCNNQYVDTVLSFIKEEINNLAKKVGDGTTSTTVLVSKILSNSKKYLDLNYSPSSIISGIRKGEKFVLDLLPKLSKNISIEDENLMTRIGIISSNGDENIGKILTNAIKKVGKYGVVNIDTSYSIDTDLKEEYTIGMSLDSGYISQCFCYKSSNMITAVAEQKKEINMENPYILLCNKRMTMISEALEKILQFISKSSKSLCIIAEDIEGELLNSLVIAHTRGIIDCVAIKIPGYGNNKIKTFEDIAILTGATVFSDANGVFLEDIDYDFDKFLGKAERIQVSQNKTIIVNGNGSQDIINKRIISLEEELNEIESKNLFSSYERDNLKERLAKLKGGICVIKVGGENEAARGEKKDRITDALYAIKAAVANGVCPGGGISFFILGLALEKALQNNYFKDCNNQEIEGINILKDSLLEIIFTITSNCLNTDPNIILYKLKDFYINKNIEDLSVIIKNEESFKEKNNKNINDNYIFGFDASTGEYGDLLAKGIINPTSVDESCIKTAIAITHQILNSKFIIIKKESN